MRLIPYWIIGILTNVFVLFGCDAYGQCSPQTGSGPAASFFSTGVGAPGATDPNWKVALDSITAPFNPAIIMSGLPASYYYSTRWISFSASGEHNLNRYFFFQINFDLPCFNPCRKSFDDDNAFCLNLDMYADNSIYEIYINGKPQSANLGNIIPLANPFNPPGRTESDKTSVSLCKDWKAGANTLIIQIASSATVAGLHVEAAVNPIPPPDADTISKTICDGEAVSFANTVLTRTGYYFHAFARPSGCDSNVVMHLIVNPKPTTIIDTSICEGSNYAGYTTSGNYINVFAAANGCDSIRQLHLTVRQRPKPQMADQLGICAGDSLILSPGKFDSYSWQDGSTNDHLSVSSPGLFRVTVSNSCGTALGTTKVVDGICNAYFPTAFTPNFDRKNDYFKILTDLRFQDYHLIVFNRWGQQIFESKDPMKGWNGQFNGKDQPPGVYVWKCIYTRSNTSKVLKGTVLLIK